MDRYQYTNTPEDHDLGDCERWDGVLCEECRLEYAERMYDREYQDYLDGENDDYSNFKR